MSTLPAGTVTFLFSDIEGSTRRWHEDPRMADVLARHDRILRAAIDRHGGHWVKHTGDGALAAFDSAAAAVAAAAAVQQDLGAEDWGSRPLRVRIGLHTGDARPSDGDYFGAVVSAAARIMSAGHGGQILLSEATRSTLHGLPEGVSLRDLGTHRIADLEPQRLAQLVAPGLRDDFPPLRTLVKTPSNLPVEPTSFVGRERELGEVTGLLGSTRLLTITGVGGAGKTRLALQAAASLLDDFPHGIWYVELASLTDPDDVVFEIAGVLGVREQAEAAAGRRPTSERLVEHLAGRELLLVIDNCEHVIGAAGRIADLVLRSGPGVRILATSREGLGVGGEVIWQIPSLRLPDPQAPDAIESDAIRLFVERVRATLPTFDPSPDTLPAVVQICRRLDGIPLAIELAAARVRVLGVPRLAERLDDRFRVLTGGSRTALPRQQTLEATIDWSYRLLSDGERSLFERLSVFAGGFTLEAAEEVCAGGGIEPHDVLDLLSGLVEKSMVVTEDSGNAPGRFHLLETLRQYARNRFADADAAVEVRRAHRDWFARFAAEAEAGCEAGELSTWAEPLRTEHENLQAALDWSQGSETTAAIAVLSAALARHWMLLGQPGRQIPYLQTALEHTHDDVGRADLRGRISQALFWLGKTEEAHTEVQRAYQLVTDAPASAAKVRVLTRFANIWLILPDQDPRRGILPAREAVKAAGQVGDTMTSIRAHLQLGRVLAWSGEPDAGFEHLETARELTLGLDDSRTVLTVLGSFFDLLYLNPRTRREEPRRHAELMLSLMGDDEEGWAEHTDFLFWVFLQSGEWDRVERALDQIAALPLEGWDRLGLLITRGVLRWMQGRLDEAWSDVAELGSLEVNPRWYHDFFPLAADVAADLGRLEQVREFADRYLAFEVDGSERSMKLGVLNPLVRAEVDAALRSTDPERTEHSERAAASLATMRRIIRETPHPTGGSVAMETPATHLAMAEAELTRVTGPDPERWRRAVAAADYVFGRLYAGGRLGESLAATGDLEEAGRVLRSTHDEAVIVGAAGIVRQLLAIATRSGIELRDDADPGS